MSLTALRAAQICFGWMALSGVMHFGADVVTPYLRGARAPGYESTLYFGMNVAFSLGQTTYGLLALWIVSQLGATDRLRPLLIGSVLVAVCWLTVAMAFIEYLPPKVNGALLVVLSLLAVLL